MIKCMEDIAIKSWEGKMYGRHYNQRLRGKMYERHYNQKLRGLNVWKTLQSKVERVKCMEDITIKNWEGKMYGRHYNPKLRR
jgi:hypothetical protein